jgi:hypothetical protein
MNSNEWCPSLAMLIVQQARGSIVHSTHCLAVPNSSQSQLSNVSTNCHQCAMRGSAHSTYMNRVHTHLTVRHVHFRSSYACALCCDESISLLIISSRLGLPTALCAAGAACRTLNNNGKRKAVSVLPEVDVHVDKRDCTVRHTHGLCVSRTALHCQTVQAC